MTPVQYKRLRMQIDLRYAIIPDAILPDGYCWLPWRTMLTERHAQVKWRAFRDDLDGRVFPSLGGLDGCRRLMRDIVSQSGFVLGATWLLAFHPESHWPADDCGTIQGIARAGRVGAIQNVGVVPEHRGYGLGRALVLKALQGFQGSGLETGVLEVTADNYNAVRLYKSIGFKVTQVLYRDAKTGETMPSGRSDSDTQAVSIE